MEPPIGAELHFHNWPEYLFTAWLAGYFDGEGCIHFRKGHLGIEFSIVNTDPSTLFSIRARLGVGAVRVLREATEKARRQYIWKVTRTDEVRALLIRLRPYLTTKARKADLAFSRIAKCLSIQQRLDEQDDKVVDLRAQGLSQREIAGRVGTSRANVSRILLRGPQKRALI